jgi:hypothetical protein
MKASEVSVGDWVEVATPWSYEYVKVREIRDGTAIMGRGRLTVRIGPNEDDPDCRKLDPDEVAALFLEKGGPH